MGVMRSSSVWGARVGVCLTPLAMLAGTFGHAQVANTWPPSGVAMVPAPAFPLAESERAPIAFVDELVIEGVAADGTFAFFGARDVDVLPDGRIVVADFQDSRVAVLSPTGQLLAHIGRQGEGPGEFADQDPRLVAATASYIVAGDIEGNRLQVFRATDYELQDTVSLPERAFLWDLAAVGTDSALTLISQRDAPLSAERDYSVSLVDLVTGSSREIVRVPEAPLATFKSTLARSDRSWWRNVPGAGGRIHVAASDDYFVISDPLEYTLVAFDPSGLPLWTVQLADQRTEITPSDQAAISEPLRQMDSRRGTDWADSVRFLETKHPAIRRLEIDPEGRLFVYRTPRRDSELVSVDVYDSTGTLLVAATMDLDLHVFWQATHAGTVYTIQWDVEDNTVIALRRLVFPSAR